MDKPASKTDAIRRHLEEHGSITSIQAFELYRATRLSAVIFSLKKKGYIFRTENVHTKDSFNRAVTYARYVFIGKDERYSS